MIGWYDRRTCRAFNSYNRYKADERKRMIAYWIVKINKLIETLFVICFEGRFRNYTVDKSFIGERFFFVSI